MEHFKNVKSLKDLRARYLELVKEHHPDHGGDTAVMQEINAEYGRQYIVLSLYEGTVKDEAPVTAEEAQRRTWREYRWVGSNYARTGCIDKDKILANIRAWLKETYPACTFSVRKHDYNSFAVSLMSANFWPFKDHGELSGDVSRWRYHDDERLTDRCREVIGNVIQYVESWNFDDSDSMTDYFHVNFYADFEIGRSGRSFEYRDPRLKTSGPVFRRKVGPVGKKVRDAIGAGNAFLHTYRFDRAGGRRILDTDSPKCLCKDDENHYPLWYSQPSLVKARLEKLAAAGITARAVRSRIELVGYSDELTAALAAEKAAEDAREKAFLESLTKKDAPKGEPEAGPVPEAAPSLTFVDYSEKAFAVVGDTRDIAARLRELGGRFNARLSCGPGWIFSKRREGDVRAALAS